MKLNVFAMLFAAALLGIAGGCKKQTYPPPSSSLILADAVVGSGTTDGGLVTNFNGTNPITYYYGAMTLLYGNRGYPGVPILSYQVSSYTGKTNLVIYHYPDTTAHSTPVYNLNLDLASGSMHSLFLTGTLANPDYLFTTDTLPYYAQADSSVGFRFVNLSPGSQPISVNLAGKSNGSEAANLAYKAITPFSKYSAASAVSSYTFEFRDAASGNLLATMPIYGIGYTDLTGSSNNKYRYRNFTACLIGIPGDPVSTQAMLVGTYALY